MLIRYRLFASLAEAAGETGGSAELPGNAAVQDLWEELERRHPVLAGLGYRPMVACDMEYASWESGLAGVGEVAFLPPVSGG